MIDFKKLAKAGVHFGHQTARWNPKMASYIWGHRSGIHLIDVSKTASQMEKAGKFLESVAAEGKQILWVGTKKPAQNAVSQAGVAKMPFVTHRWIGGTLTNNSQVRKSITRLLHYEDILDKSSQFHYNKKELGVFQKIAQRLQQNVGGIRTLRWPVGAVVLVDVRKEQTALREAVAMGIPVVAMVDTNGDPSLVNYVIPANDDSPKAIQVVMEYLVEAAQKGLQSAAAKKVQVEENEALAEKGISPEEIRLPGFEEEEEKPKVGKGSAAPRPAAGRRPASNNRGGGRPAPRKRTE
jgi:small subunit ribosomal protein S2